MNPMLGGVDAEDYAFDAFLSYNRADEVSVSALAQRLESEEIDNRRLKVFFAPWDIEPGESIPGKIEVALSKSRIVVIVISPESLRSEWVQLERTAALHRVLERGTQRIVPLLLRGSEVPPLLAPLRQIDFRAPADPEAAYRSLVAVVKGTPIPRVASEARAAPEPPPLSSGRRRGHFVTRHDNEGRDLRRRLGDLLSQRSDQPVALWGAGGVGKTTLAAEVAADLERLFPSRVVWLTADGRDDFSHVEIVTALIEWARRADLYRAVTAVQAEELRKHISAAPTVLILDNFETVGAAEQHECLALVGRLGLHSFLITTRDEVENALHIPLNPMTPEEAHELVVSFISNEAHQPAAVTVVDRDELIRAAGHNPGVLRWVLAQVDLAQDPRDVLTELALGEGAAAQRVFDRSFDLPQLGKDGRAALLALTLFSPSASREALAHVAGFGTDTRRLNKGPVRKLSSLWLLGTTGGNRRLLVEGLTREVAQAKLARQPDADAYRGRFVRWFMRYCQERSSSREVDLQALDNESSNIVGAMDLAFGLGDRTSGFALANALHRLFHARGHWLELMPCVERALAAARDAGDAREIALFTDNLADLHQHCGNFDMAKQLYGVVRDLSAASGDELGAARVLHQLGLIAQMQGDYAEARRLYQSTLAAGIDEDSRAITLHNLGFVALREGDFKAADDYLSRSLPIFQKGSNLRHVAEALETSALLEIARGGDLAVAEARLTEAHASATGDHFRLARIALALGELQEQRGEIREAARLFAEALTGFTRLGAFDAGRARASLGRVTARMDASR